MISANNPILDFFWHWRLHCEWYSKGRMRKEVDNWAFLLNIIVEVRRTTPSLLSVINKFRALSEEFYDANENSLQQEDLTVAVVDSMALLEPCCCCRIQNSNRSMLLIKPVTGCNWRPFFVQPCPWCTTRFLALSLKYLIIQRCGERGKFTQTEGCLS